MFDFLLYTSLVIFLLGLIFKILSWFTQSIGNGDQFVTTGQRLRAAASGIFGTIFSSKIILIIKAILVDVLLAKTGHGLAPVK